MKIKPLLFTGISLALLTTGIHAQDTKAPAAKAAEAAPAEKEKVVLTASEQKAVDGYKVQMLAIQKWLTDYRDSTDGNEARAHRIPVLLAEKLTAVKATGLPARIAEPLAALQKNVNAQAALLKDIPKDDAEAMEWMITKLADEKWAAEADNLRAGQSELEHKLVYAAAPCGAGKESDLFQSTELSQIKERWVVILGAYKKFKEAQAEARKVAKATGTTFTLRGMIHDKKGLRMPDDLEDEVYAGQYVQRRGNDWAEGEKVFENHISVEMSAGYDGFEPGYYIPVGFIAETAAEAEKQAAVFKKHAPGTYVKKTEIFMGCDR